MKNDGAVISCIIQSKEGGGGVCFHGYGPPTLTNMSAAERKGLRVKRTIRDDPRLEMWSVIDEIVLKHFTEQT